MKVPIPRTIELNNPPNNPNTALSFKTVLSVL